ncbi:hypothetical protein Poli38472_012829 [Pythium oligandrum]|uniref:Tyrosyl-DNA phosphodiesterase 1 n=1 Tax=Pythium oligandrum TaxID=41045 RepID=A0A8K1CIS9_PYTOL|nr:hypothetical protein Poli38472_012829 [Pythium oligandrum]|eukprot:TMW64207.1 hypothetical protein Poli38472_012829 [Pythium oligandrum]
MGASVVMAEPPSKRAKTAAPSDTETKAERLQAAVDAVEEVSVTEDASVDVLFRLTRLKDAPERHNRYAIGLQELFEGEYTQCLLTNYMYDLPWLFASCPRLHDVPVVLVHGERDRHAMTQECKGYGNVTPVAPYLPIPYGTHHTKMAVLLYPTKARVAIFTANFIAIDWHNKTQGVWFQDFELKALGEDDASEEKKQHQKQAAVADFERDLIEYLSTLGTPVVTFCKELSRFDFSTATVALIPSVPGAHTGKAMHKYGHLRVRALLKHFAVAPSDHPLICQFSSLGSLDEKWLFGEFAGSLMPGPTQLASGGSTLPIKALHIIWPSVNDVRNSVEGWNAGRAVPCPLKNMKPFLHKYLRKWTPPSALHRQNAMPHIKTYARFDPKRDGCVDWAILTSSNLSKAAWGAYQKNQSQFLIRSYELGVLFLPSASSHQHLSVVGTPAANTEDSIPTRLMPLPYAFPLTTYNPKEDEPWVWDLVRDEPDVYGNCYIPR